MYVLVIGAFMLFNDSLTIEYTTAINPYTFGVFFVYLISIILLAVSTAKTVKVWHWVIGSPTPTPHDNKTLSYIRGRILSGYGRWLKRNYDNWEKKWDAKIKELCMSEGYELGSMEYIQRFEQLDEAKRPPNPFKALGGCLICFSFYPTYIILTISLVIAHTTITPLPVLIWVLGYILFWGLVVATLTSDYFD